MDSAFELRGVLAALTTPFVDGRPAPERLRDNLQRYGRAGLSGFLVLGSTGESILLDERERITVLRAARDAIRPGASLIAGVTGESTRGAEEQARAAAAAGADAVLVSTPHYYRSQMTHQALRAFFDRLADASPVPVLLYNVPKFTNFVLPVETVVGLSRCRGIGGIKESSGEPDYLRAVASGSADGFRIACGAAGVLCEAFAGGADAAILALAAAIPEPFVAIAERMKAGDEQAARGIQRGLREVGALSIADHGVPGIKAAMDARGLYGGAVRAPLLTLPRDARTGVVETLERLVELRSIDQLEL